MKYKIIGLAACLTVLLASVLIPLAASDDHARYHHHLEAAPKAVCQHGEDVFCSHLPLVEIETNGTEIPGKPIFDENGLQMPGYTTAADGSSTISAQIKIRDSKIQNNHLTDSAMLDSKIQIRVRGNSSRVFDKSSYAIRLVDENGINAPQCVMGMDAHHEWVLHGPYLDKSLLRNYMWYNIAGEIMDYAPNVRFCEVILNGEYQGLYVMAENITAGKEGARLNLSVDKKDSTFSGYLLRLDRGSDNPLQNLDSFTAYTRRTAMTLEVVYPGADNLTEKLQTAIRQDFSDFEKALYSYDYDSKKHGYAQYIDTQSFVDYFLINEFTCNYDAGWLSTYMYKDLDGRYRMCVWDFNSACDNYQESMNNPDHFEMQNCLWYFMLLKDEYFTDRLISRYYQLRKTYFDEDYLNSYIDDVIAYLGPAIDRNYEKWGYTFDREYDLLHPAERNPRSYEEAIADMKAFFHKRIAWMDDNIETLRQYSAESKVKKFNENAN